jgi:Peptidase S24-like
VATKDFKDLLRDAMAEVGIDPPTLARELKVSRQTVYKWLSGQLPSHRHARALDARLGLSTFPVSNILPAPSNRMARRVPLIEGMPNSSALSGACVVNLRSQNWVEADSELSAQAIAFRLGGDAMEPEFYSGEIVIVDPQLEPQNGDYVIAEIFEENQENSHGLWTFTQYRPRGHHRGQVVYDLVPLNPSYKTVTVGPDSPGRIVGTMVEHRRRPRLRTKRDISRN